MLPTRSKSRNLIQIRPRSNSSPSSSALPSFRRAATHPLRWLASLQPLQLIILGIIAIALIIFSFSPGRGYDKRTGRTRSKFRIDKSHFLAPPPYDPPPDHLPLPLAPKKEGMVVPNSVHYVYGLKPLKEGQTGDEWPYYAYLAIRSALIHLKPEKLYFHYEHLPTGPWWDLLEPELTLMKTQSPTTFLGRNITHFAHKADIIRLLLMRHSGGIYLDIDMFIVKPFDDLLYFPTTLGWEAATESYRNVTDPEGLCVSPQTQDPSDTEADGQNAVIISAPHSAFIDRWIATYETFDEHGWAQHSVKKPWELARRYPDEIQVLSSRAFFWPMWYGEEIQYTHEKNDYDFYKTGQYAYHAWESLAMKYLEKLSPTTIREDTNSFNRMIRPFIGPNDDDVYARWKSSQRQ